MLNKCIWLRRIPEPRPASETSCYQNLTEASPTLCKSVAVVSWLDSKGSARCGPDFGLQHLILACVPWHCQKICQKHSPVVCQGVLSVWAGIQTNRTHICLFARSRIRKSGKETPNNGVQQCWKHRSTGNGLALEASRDWMEESSAIYSAFWCFLCSCLKKHCRYCSVTGQKTVWTAVALSFFGT